MSDPTEPDAGDDDWPDGDGLDEPVDDLPDNHWPNDDDAEEGADYERPQTEESIIGRWAGKAIATIPKPMFGIRATLFKRMATKSINNYYKTISGADAIAINAKAGQRLDLVPVAYRAADECGDDEVPGWYAKGRDTVWTPATEGNSVNFLNGKTPTVMLEDDDHVEAGFLASRIGEAIEMDNYWPVFTNPTFRAHFNDPSTTKQVPAAGQQPLADGGAQRQIQQPLDQWAYQNLTNVEFDKPGVWSGENIIDLNSGAEYDGMRISTAKAREWRAEHADSEAMKRAEDRGRLMEALGGEDVDITRLFIYAALFALAVIGVVLLGPELVGGGGGGGINPLMINAVGALL